MKACWPDDGPNTCAATSCHTGRSIERHRAGVDVVAAAGEGAAEVPAFAPLYAVYAPVKREPATATLIPYFAWANRGENEMTVWLRG